MAMEPAIEVRVEDHVAFITMREGKNQLNLQFLQKLRKALQEVISNDGVKALITTGVDKNYSQGIDLAWFAQQDENTLDQFWAVLFDVLCTLLTLPMPTVAAINGHAFAGGAFLALAHDYIVMNTERGWFSFNEIYLPSRIPEFLLQLLRYKVPAGPVQNELLAMGHRYTAAEAVKSGLVQRACSKGELLGQAKEIVVERLRNGDMPRIGVGEMKKDLYFPITRLAKSWQFIDRSKL